MIDLIKCDDIEVLEEHELIIAQRGETEHEKAWKKDMNFFQEIIHNNKLNAESHINTGAIIGEFAVSTKNYNNAKKVNNQTKKENVIKDENLKAKQAKEKETKEMMMNMDHQKFRKSSDHLKKTCNREIEAGGHPEAYAIYHTKLDADHLFTMPEIQTNKNGILDLLLAATPNGTFEEVRDLINDEKALVWIYATLNRSKRDRAGTCKEDFPSFTHYVEKHKIPEQYVNLRAEKVAQLDELKAAELLKYKHGHVYKTSEMVFGAYLRMFVTTTIYHICDLFTDFVEDALLEHCMRVTEDTFSIGKVLSKVKDKIMKLKDGAVEFYKTLVKMIKLPTLSELIDALKNAVTNVFSAIGNFIKGFFGKVKNTIKGIKDLVMGIFTDSKHERHKKFIGIIAAALTGAFAFVMEMLPKLYLMIQIAIKTLIITLAKIALIITYTIVDLQDRYGEITEKYNVFTI